MKQFLHNLDNFSGGSMTTISDARLGKKESYTKFAPETVNLIQEEDGVWCPRPGTAYYGKAIPADGIVYASEYTKQDKSREIVVIGTDGKGYKSTDNGETWTLIPNYTFTNTEQFNSLQFKGQLWISNGVDPLVYYDGTFHSFTPLTDPLAAPTIKTTGSGLTTGSYTYYLRYTVNNDVGYTNPSPALTVTANKPREQWKLENNEYLEYEVPIITDAKSYDLWLGDTSGQEYHLGSITDRVYKDTGTPINSFRMINDDNTTSAPKILSMELSGNRMWATKDSENPWRVYGTGTGQYLGFFSPFYGGFWIDLEKGSKYYPTAVVHYRTGKGDPTATVLCSSADGNGVIFQVDLTSINVGDVTITVPIGYKLVGSRGTSSTNSVVKFGDNIGFLNQKGVFFLRNKEQLFNVLATDDMTAPIRNEYLKLNQLQLHKAVAYFSPPRIYFSVPKGNDNDITFTWDDERRNWSWAWTIGFKHLLEVTDTGGTTHLLGIRKTDARLIEITATELSDLGQDMLCQYVSPLIPIDSNDHRIQAKINESIFEVGELRGQINCTVLGRTKKADITALKSKPMTATGSFSNSGVSDDYASDFLASDTNSTTRIFSAQSKKRSVKVRKKVYALKYRVTSLGSSNYWRLYSIQSNGPYVIKKSPGDWRRD